MSYWSIYYPSMIHSNKYRPSYSLSISRYNCVGVSGDVGGGVGPSTNYFSSQKVHFGRDRYYEEFMTYQSHPTGFPVA